MYTIPSHLAEHIDFIRGISNFPMGIYLFFRPSTHSLLPFFLFYRNISTFIGIFTCFYLLLPFHLILSFPNFLYSHNVFRFTKNKELQQTTRQIALSLIPLLFLTYLKLATSFPAFYLHFYCTYISHELFSFTKNKARQ
jgi:hypothetical protein